MRLFSTYLLAVILSIVTANVATAKVEAVIGSVVLGQNLNLVGPIPDTENPEILISREQYLISYNKVRRAANWVAWKIERSNLGKSGRSNKFTKDSELEKYLSQNSTGDHAVDTNDYKNSCFDRGHQIPSADRTDTVENNVTTFAMSNMIPQTAFLNRGLWSQLEQYTRNLVLNQSKKVYVITGPVYDQDFGAIGPQKDIVVPSKDFKILIVLEASQTLADINKDTPMIAVMMPNTLKDGASPVNATPQQCAQVAQDLAAGGGWEKYKTSVSDIESRSGLRFQFSQ